VAAWWDEGKNQRERGARGETVPIEGLKGGWDELLKVEGEIRTVDPTNQTKKKNKRFRGRNLRAKPLRLEKGEK